MQSRKRKNPENSISFITQELSLTPKALKFNSSRKNEMDDHLTNIVHKENIHSRKIIYSSKHKQQLVSMHQAVLSGDLDALKKLIAQNPELLLHELKETECESIIGPSGHKASLTVYRSALATEDTQMSNLVKTQLIEMHAKEDAEKQFSQQFPEKWQEIEKKKWEPIFTQLRRLTHIIEGVEPGDIKRLHYKLKVKEGSYVAKTLFQFRALLNETLNTKATTGRHFNPNLLLDAFKIYNTHPTFQPDNLESKENNLKSMLFWQQVIGFIQRFMPANYAQAFCDGTSLTEERLQRDEPQNRSFDFVISYLKQDKCIDTHFYPLSDSRLGFDFALYPVGAGNMEPQGLAGDENPNSVDMTHGFPEYIKHKEKYIQDLINPKQLEVSAKRFLVP